jgi:chemotaxis protein MotB
MKGKALALEQERLVKCTTFTRIRRLDCSKRSEHEKKETLSKALNSFEGKGLTVQQKNGKVYVSMENKLLFNLGVTVGAEGKKAVVELGKVWETILILPY